jgi:signal transduction histidine kinase
MQTDELPIAILSHDLRVPLTALLIHATVLEGEHQLSAEARRAVTRIVRAASRASAILAAVDEWTHARAGRLPITPAPVALDRIVRDVLDELRVVYPWRIVTVETRGDARGTWDAARLAQAVSNLIGNALAHGSDGSVVDVLVRGGAGHVQLEVSHPRAHTPLADASLGVGLFVVREIVRAHRGVLAVDHGETTTTFLVTLPRSVAA